MAACAAKFGVEATAEAGATGGLMIPVIVLGGLATLFGAGSSTDESPSKKPSEKPSKIPSKKPSKSTYEFSSF